MIALRSALLLASFLVLNVVGCGHKPPPDDPNGNLIVLLPADANEYPDRDRYSKLTVDGKDYSEPKDARRQLSIQPQSGKDSVTVVFDFWTNSYTNFIRTRVVKIEKGKTVQADLTKEDPAFPDQIKPIYVPTPNEVVERMCKLGKVGKGDVVYDIGCGDGRLVIMAVEKFGAKRGVGIDINPDLVEQCQANAKKAGVADRTEFRVDDALKLKDLSEASVVLLYLGDDLNLKMRPILQKTLKPGSRVLSHRFTMGDWKPERSEKFTAKNNSAEDDDYEIHLWTIKR